MMKRVLLALLFVVPLFSQAQTPADTLVVVQSFDDAGSFDPAQGFELTTVQAFTSLYQRLVQSSPLHPAELQPALASRWDAGADNHSLTFTLREGATFASGNPVRPEDVIFSLARVIKLDKEPSFILEQFGWTPDNIGTFLQKVNDHQVKVSWPVNISPDYALSLLSAPVASIVDARTVLTHQKKRDLGNLWLATHSAGSGPYQISDVVAHQMLRLTANPSSPAGAPKLKHVLIKHVPEPAARRIMLEQGDADIASNLGVDQMNLLSSKSGVKTQILPTSLLYFLQFNTKASPVLGNPAFWEAARYLFDYNDIVENQLKDEFSVHQTFLPQGFTGALEETPFHYDPVKAQEILTQAGLKDVRFTLSVAEQLPYLDIAQALQMSFARGGVQVELQTGSSSDIAAAVKKRRYQATLSSWGADYYDPNTYASAFAWNPENGRVTLAMRSGWVNPDLNQKTLAAIAATTQEQRVHIYQQMQREVLARSPYVIGLQGRSLIGMRENVQGYVQGINPDMVYYNQVTK